MFGAIQKLLRGASPVCLYDFQYGPFPDSHYRYTNAGDDITVQGVTYRAVTIGHGKVKSTGSLDNSTVEITMALGNEMSQLYGKGNPVDLVSIAISRMHLTDPDRDVKPFWNGNVMNSKFTEEQDFILACEPVSRSLRRIGLGVNYQPTCPYALYDPNTCRVDPAKFSRVVPVLDVNGIYVTVGEGWRIDPFYYPGGIMEFSMGGFHGNCEIKSVANNTFRLGQRPIGLEAGGQVSIRPGCGRSTSACAAFENMPNFGGCPRAPTATPYADRNIWG